ncbi:hypothetical protein LTR78_010689 [Recurvomyces mirabilis]|uniref:DUF2241 domain-containing protein n=1 Tax=Recurvomyces mirabilis TaxID=574656 RepID=A0AAE0WG42_9PEZI|nr:hypothetical protein LTR78_010689 [Recurvomyces mirabilis]KAK5158240.1 hypothetical protein LTS14_003258 [Recurvomyces mirabilis]
MATPSPGGVDLSNLIKTMSPSLHNDTCVWITISPSNSASQEFLKDNLWNAEMLFREAEGYTMIITKALADEADMDYVFPCRKITLNVHSSLEAVGFMAAIATRLTSIRTGSNPVSGYYHDHLFLPVGKEGIIVEELKKMAAEQS